MDGFFEHEVVDLGFVFFPNDVVVDPNWFKAKRKNVEDFLEETLLALREKQPIDPDCAAYKLCKYHNKYFHISEFAAHDKGAGVLRFSTYTKKGDNQRSKDKVKIFNDINYPLFRYWFNGDETEQLKCMVTKQCLEDITQTNPSTGETKTFNIFELHHMLTVRGLSVHKIDVNVQPSYLLGKKDLNLPKFKPQLVDIMNTIPISPNEHAIVHRFEDSDIRYWDKRAKGRIPWGLKSEDNFNSFCNSLNLKLNYSKFLDCQHLEWYEANKHKIDLKKETQDIVDYMQRFE